MTIRRPARCITLLSVFLLLALSLGTLNFHVHAGGPGKTCTLCHAPHVQGWMGTGSALARPLPLTEQALPRLAEPVSDTFISSASSRGPPATSPAV